MSAKRTSAPQQRSQPSVRTPGRRCSADMCAFQAERVEGAMPHNPHVPFPASPAFLTRPPSGLAGLPDSPAFPYARFAVSRLAPHTHPRPHAHRSHRSRLQRTAVPLFCPDPLPITHAHAPMVRTARGCDGQLCHSFAPTLSPSPTPTRPWFAPLEAATDSCATLLPRPSPHHPRPRAHGSHRSRLQRTAVPRAHGAWRPPSPRARCRPQAAAAACTLCLPGKRKTLPAGGWVGVWGTACGGHVGANRSAAVPTWLGARTRMCVHVLLTECERAACSA
eukprot:360884-Chlamydomonas_euryale.AAC.1